MKPSFNPEQKNHPRWPLCLLLAIGLFLLCYFLIPTLLCDDIYLSILIAPVQSLILGLIGLSTLLGARLYYLDYSKRPTASAETGETSAVSQLPSEPNRKLSIAAISQFLSPKGWSIEFIQKLNPTQFTHMCLAYYEIKGIPHRTHRLGLSSGINILILQNDLVSKVIHCSHDQQVEMIALRQLLGVMVHERALAGVYIHRGAFSEEVGNFAVSHNIQLRNEYALLAKIQKLSERRQQQLLKIVLD